MAQAGQGGATKVGRAPACMAAPGVDAELVEAIVREVDDGYREFCLQQWLRELEAADVYSRHGHVL